MKFVDLSWLDSTSSISRGGENNLLWTYQLVLCGFGTAADRGHCILLFSATKGHSFEQERTITKGPIKKHRQCFVCTTGWACNETMSNETLKAESGGYWECFIVSHYGLGRWSWTHPEFQGRQSKLDHVHYALCSNPSRGPKWNRD